MREEFRELFKAKRIPSGAFKFRSGESVLDLTIMIRTHLDLLDGTASDRVKRPYKLRLEELLERL